MFYKNFARNLFQHSTKFLIVLSLASFVGACASSGDDDAAPAKKPNNVPMPTEITLTEALNKTASAGKFATDPDMNDLQKVDGATLANCPAVETAENFSVRELSGEDDLKKALGKISSGLSQCEKFITDSITTLMANVKDATLGIGTESATDNEEFKISYGGLVEDASGALNVTNLSADNTESGHWSWRASTDSTVSLVIYVDSASTAYAIGKQESAGKGVFKIYCKTNVTGEDLISYCLQYRYADASGDFDANAMHVVDAAGNAKFSRYIGNLKAPHAYTFTTETGTGTANDAYTLESADLKGVLVAADYQYELYSKFNPITTLLGTMVGAGRDGRKTALQTTELKETLTAAQGVLNYSNKATDDAKLAKAYEELMAGTAGATGTK